MKKLAVIIIAVIVTADIAKAASGTWLGNDGDWGDTGTWSGGTIADGSGFIANFTGVNINANRTITLNGSRTIGSIIFTDLTTSSHDMTISGANILTLAGTPTINVTQADRALNISSQISGAENITKTGLGTLTLSGNNNYTGQSIIQGGTLRLANTSAVSGGGQITMNTASGTIEFVTDTAFTIGSTLSLSGVYTRTLVSDRATAGAGLTQSLAIISAGNGTSLDFTKGNNVTSGTAGFSFTTLNMNGNAGSFTLNPTTAAVTVGAVNNTTANAKTLILNGTSTGNTITGVIASGSSGIVNLTKDNTSTWTLSGANTYSGATTVSAGVLNLQHDTAVGTTAGGVSVTSGAALQLQHATGITIGAEGLTLNGTGVSSAGALRNISGNNTYGGAITLGSAVRINSDSGTLTLNNATAITSSQNLTFGGAGNIAVSTALNMGGTSTVTKDGAGTLTLSGANTYTGNTTVNAGTLSLAGGSALADTTSLYTSSAAKINLAANETVSKLNLNGSEAQAGTWGSSASSATYKWDLYFTGTAVLTVSTGTGVKPAIDGTMFLVH